ncbi:MAG: TraX family protein [Cypionkella sp.]
MRTASTWHLSSGAVEALKWLALACMVVDHVHAVFFGRDLGMIATAIGRVAMPLFAIVIGYNLARPGIDLARLARRLLLVGALATPFYAYLFVYLGWFPLNVLFTFAVAVLALHLSRNGYRLLALGILAAGGLVVEYHWPGVVLVLASYALARRPSLATLSAALLALLMLCLINDNLWALLALPLVVAASHWSLHVPRAGRFFLWFYPAHLALLALAVWLSAPTL